MVTQSSSEGRHNRHMLNVNMHTGAMLASNAVMSSTLYPRLNVTVETVNAKMNNPNFFSLLPILWTFYVVFC